MRSYNLRPEARPRRTPIVGQGRSNGQTIAPQRFVFGRLVRVLGTLNWSHASQLLLQLRFGMLVGLVERLGGVFQVVKLTELMRYPWKHKSHGTADGFFSIGDHPFDCYFQLLEQFLH